MSGFADVSLVGDFEKGKTFTGPMIALGVIAFIVGAAFAWAASQAATAHQLIEIQQADAAKLRDQVVPRVQAFADVATKVKALNVNTPDFEAAEALAVDNFVVTGSILASVTIPMPGRATSSVANYAADSANLRSLLAEHNRFTNVVDKEELQALLEENKEIEAHSGFGVIIDPRAISEWESDSYRPKMGQLVGFRRAMEDEKKVEIAILPGGDVRQVNLHQFIPIEKSQILKAGGQNALQRYSLRVRNLKYHVDQIEKYSASVIDAVNVAAGAEPTIPQPAAEEE